MNSIATIITTLLFLLASSAYSSGNDVKDLAEILSSIPASNVGDVSFGEGEINGVSFPLGVVQTSFDSAGFATKIVQTMKNKRTVLVDQKDGSLIISLVNSRSRDCPDCPELTLSNAKAALDSTILLTLRDLPGVGTMAFASFGKDAERVAQGKPDLRATSFVPDTTQLSPTLTTRYTFAGSEVTTLLAVSQQNSADLLNSLFADLTKSGYRQINGSLEKTADQPSISAEDQSQIPWTKGDSVINLKVFKNGSGSRVILTDSRVKH